MTPIDLTDYALASRKIPKAFLAPKQQATKVISTFNIFIAHLVDLALVLGASTLVFAIFKTAMKSFMMTHALRHSYDAIPFYQLESLLLPLSFTSYFFFSNFLNEGQSFGLMLFKARVEIPFMSYRSSLFWGMYSAMATMSCGISLLSYDWMKKKGWGEIQPENNLYANLLDERDLSPINLLREIEKFHQTKETEVEEDYLQAA